MAKVSMKVVGQPFRGVAVGETVRVSLKDSRAFADNLQAIDAAPKRAPAKKTAARKAPAKKVAAKSSGYRTRALKAK